MSNLNLYLSIFLFTSTLMATFVAIYSLQQREVPAARSFAYLCFASSIYSFGYAMELLSSKLNVLIQWNFFQYIGVEFISVFWILVAIQYCGIENLLSRLAKLILFAIPIFNLFILYTNPIHHLFYKNIFTESNGFFTVLSIEKGPYYVINSFYIVSSVICSNILFLRLLIQSKGKFQYQSGIMFLGSILPLTAHFMLVLNVNPLEIDFAPFFLTLSFLLILIGLFKFKLFNLVPLAHEKVFESIKDAVIVLDKHFNVLDFNPVAAEVFCELNKLSIGKNIEFVLGKNNEFIRLILDEKDSQFEKKEGKRSKFYSVKISILKGTHSKIMGYIVSLHNITKQIENMNNLKIIATIDNLTDVYNRRTFLDACEQKLVNARLSKSPISLIMLDLDRFKRINDQFGHQAGDAMLREVAKVCKSSIRSGDIIGRFGGEEFMVLLPNTTIASAVEIGDRVRKNIENLTVYYEGKHLKITASIGISGLVETIEEDLDLLIKFADAALYQAKKNGRNCVMALPFF